MAVSCMRNASGHNYKNSSCIVELATLLLVDCRINGNILAIFCQ